MRARLDTLLAAGVAAPLACTLMLAASPARTEQGAFDCLLEPRYRIKLASPVAGVLKEVKADRGDIIHKGDILATLESGVEKAMLDLAVARAENDAAVKAREARLAFLTRKRDRLIELQKKGAASTAALDEAESDFGVASQDLREAESNQRIAKLEVARASEVLRQRSIVSPIDGVVAERNLLGGEYAYEQAPIMSVAQIDPLNVEVFVPVSLYGAVTLGMQAVVIGEQPVGGRHIATVEVIDPLIDSRSGTFGVRLVLPNPQHKIPAGLRCRIEFPVEPGGPEANRQ
jgi:RND family efflux transporter MFP subunit